MIARKTGLYLCYTMLIGVLIFAVLAPLAMVSAQTNEEMFTQAQTQILNAEGITLELIQSTQNPENKTIKFDLKITSQIRSDRVQMRWETIGPAEIVLGEKSANLNLTVGGTYQYSVVILPRASNRADLRAVVEAFQIDGTRLSSATQTMFFQPDGEILYPVTPQHNTAKLVYLVRSVSGSILVFLLVTGLVYRAGRVLINWLKN